MLWISSAAFQHHYIQHHCSASAAMGEAMGVMFNICINRSASSPHKVLFINIYIDIWYIYKAQRDQDSKSDTAKASKTFTITLNSLLSCMTYAVITT
jgi:hypothetical protein